MRNLRFYRNSNRHNYCLLYYWGAREVSKQKAKRTKKYSQRLVNIPVTGLIDEFSLVLHSAMTAAQYGFFTRDLYDKLGQAINTVRMALEVKPPKDKSIIIVIAGVVRSMNEVGVRGDATGVWGLRASEQATLFAGIGKLEEALQRMDVLTLYAAMQRLKTLT